VVGGVHRAAVEMVVVVEGREVLSSWDGGDCETLLSMILSMAESYVESHSALLLPDGKSGKKCVAGTGQIELRELLLLSRSASQISLSCKFDVSPSRHFGFRHL
jgi:hypothetical protein